MVHHRACHCFSFSFISVVVVMMVVDIMVSRGFLVWGRVSSLFLGGREGGGGCASWIR